MARPSRMVASPRASPLRRNSPRASSKRAADRSRRLGDGEYALHPVYRAADGRCSILIVVLRPGTPLPVHNHGSWAVIGVYKGREHETWFRRVDAGSVPGRARLEVERTFVNERGTVGVVPDGRIHTVQAHGGAQAVSIHVYGTDIVTQQRSEFDLETGTERVFRPPFEEAAATAGRWGRRHWPP